MGSFTQVSRVRYVYRLRPLALGLCLAIGAGFICYGAYMAFASHSSVSRSGAPLIVSLFPFGFGAFTVLWPLRARVVIEGSRISVRNLVKERTADLSQIEGLRTIQTHNGSYSRLYLKEGRGSITISKSFNFDDAARAWFQQIADLDQRDRAALLDEISKEQELGATAEERLGKLSTAKIWNRSLIAVNTVAAAAPFFGEPALRVPAAAVLAITPVVVFFLLQRSPLVFAISNKNADPRPELNLALIASAVGLLMSSKGLNIISERPLSPVIAAVGLAYFFALYSVSRHKGPAWRGTAIMLVFLAWLYSFSFAEMEDTISDHAPATTYRADVVDKRISDKTYYLVLSPWGPVEYSDEVNVSPRVYDEFNVGDQVCLSLHPGSLHAPWYQLVDCSDHLISSPTL